MNTQKPLKELVPAIINQITIVQQNQTIYETKLLDIYEGQIQKYVEESIRGEFSASAAERAIKRIAPINILTQTINKISTVYGEPVDRTAGENDIDTDNLSFYESKTKLDTVLNTANKMLNLFRYCALEPYVSEGEPQIRVLPPTQFTVFSDDPINPTNPTVFIKFMGQAPSIMPRTQTDGVKIMGAEEEVIMVDIFFLYSDTEFLIVDREGSIRSDLMIQVGNPEGVNPFGVIPFVYLNQSDLMLIPLPNSDLFQMSILIPKLLTDLNYATKFQSHAIVYGIDIDASQLEGNPDSFWDIKSAEGDDKSPQLGTIKPEVDVDKVLTLINTTIDLWLDSIGLKSSGGAGSLNPSNAASGVSKIIDSADATNIRKQQKKFFKGTEKDLWELFRIMNKQWITDSSIKDRKDFSKEFSPVINHGDPKVFIDPEKELKVIKEKLDNKLTSYKRAVMKANPELTEAEAKELIEEIQAEELDRALRAQISLRNNSEESEE